MDVCISARVEKGDGGVGLRVEINQQGFFLALGDGGGKIDGCGGLTHAAFLIGNCQDGRHRIARPLCGGTRASRVEQPSEGSRPRAKPCRWAQSNRVDGRKRKQKMAISGPNEV